MQQVDTATGEIIEGFVAYVAPKRMNGFRQGWVAMTQGDALEELAKEDLGYEAMRVLFVLLANIEHENHVLVPQTELAARIGMAKQNFNRGVKRLVERGVVEYGPKIGRMVSLKLNPEYGWKGSARNHVVALDEKRKERMQKAGITGVIDGKTTPDRDPNTADMFGQA